MKEEIMNSGDIYNVGQSVAEFSMFEYLKLMDEYNAAGHTEEGLAKKERILSELFGAIGKNCYIQAPYHAMWGGHHVYLGDNVYINFNATFVDDANIYIGDGTMVAPNVTFVAASHPISPTLRSQGYGFNKPIHIGKNCWIGSNAVIMHGVHVGDNSIVGAGSVVTKDVPNNVIVIGNPAIVLREISPDDEIYYDHGKLISEHIF